ncbi:hypothetical protein HY745_01500, partial [Candidatus Desantisbacteria bacterium]|nr:hypothetical protein [Candidatus Desantisbacteria bacterium]
MLQEKIKYLIDDLQNKKIHIVGLSSSECMNIILFLCKYGINPQTIKAHDFSGTYEEFIKSFNTNHV